MTVALAMLLAVYVYIRLMPKDCKDDPVQVCIRMILGATEAFYGDFFKYGLAGYCLMMTFELASYSLNAIYNVNLRAFIIGENPIAVPSSFNELDILTDHVVYTEQGLSFFTRNRKN